MNNDDINEYVPSLLNPRTVKKLNGNLTLTQNSVVSRCSLSLKKKNVLSQVTKNLQKIFASGKENAQNNSNLPLNKEASRNRIREDRNIDLLPLEELNPVFSKPQANFQKSIDNVPNSFNLQPTRELYTQKTIEENSIGFSAIEDLNTIRNNIDSSPFSFCNLELPQNRKGEGSPDESLTVVSSVTELVDSAVADHNDSTLIYDITEQPLVSVSFGLTNCETVDISTNKSNIKKIVVTHKDNTTTIDCDMIEDTVISLDNDTDEDMEEKVPLTLPKRSDVSVNLEIKKKKLSAEVTAENSKVLILNTNAIERLSHVIVQPPNYKLVKRQIFDKSKFKNSGKRRKVSGAINGKTCDNLKQTRIDSFLNKSHIKVSANTFAGVSSDQNEDVVRVDDEVMSRNLSASEAGKCDRVGRASVNSSRRENEVSPKSIRLVQRKAESPRSQQIKLSSSEAQRVPSKARNDSTGSHSPRKNIDSLQFNLPAKSRSHRNSLSPRRIPHYKIVAGTHFAVDAFSYGDIPNVKHYFLTHFHSDHYSGLKKGFNKFLFCSQITADLCISRLGVSPKCIHIINLDVTITVDGIEVTAVDANHCPGAVMLVFTLPNGKTLLHTGDFRASPMMESYPVFWNKDIHTIYLDTTYCNPRYDFPTQDQSLEMALYLLRQKKLALEKAGKKFSSVLIVCGTYTIGKEKFFLGMARRVGCSVWACPEKDRVLQAVEGRSFSRAPPHSCQLHVVPMRDLTHEKLRIYLNTLQGAFSEVVAFKPSGWENGKNSSSERDSVTIHGIPYSEHSSFSEMIRFVKFLKPKQVVPTVDISGGIKSVQKYFPCPMVCKDESTQNKLTDYFSIQLQNQQPSSAVT